MKDHVPRTAKDNVAALSEPPDARIETLKAKDAQPAQSAQLLVELESVGTGRWCH